MSRMQLVIKSIKVSPRKVLHGLSHSLRKVRQLPLMRWGFTCHGVVVYIKSVRANFDRNDGTGTVSDAAPN
jgi:hypothetical protein